MLNPQIFREYDIRGIAEADLTDDVVEGIGRAFGTYVRRRGARRLAVGRDVRLSSPRIRDALVKGLLRAGCDVVDVGQVPTPVLYFAVLHLKADGGVMVTGSHNPIEYNGLKLCYPGVQAVYGDHIQELRRCIEAGDFEEGDGTLAREDVVEAYISTIASRIRLERPLKVVVDAGNGTTSEIGPKLLRELGAEVVPLYCEVDGSFPNHLPDPTIPEYLEDLRKEVLKTGADLGIGWDGDGDRIGVLDDEGEIIWGDRLLALYARDVLERLPGSTIVFDVKCSQALVEDVEAHGGRPLMWKTGHSLIKAKMKEEGAPLAGEMSGHMFFSDGYFGYDDALYAAARLLGILSRTPRKLSEIASEIPKYLATPEIRIDCPDEEKFRVVRGVADHFRERYPVIEIDGVRVQFGDGWGLVRASNTQPVLVLRFEARTPERLGEIAREVVSVLERYPSVSGLEKALREAGA